MLIRNRTAWVLPENAGVAASVDFLGHNGFPYFENTKPNSIDLAADNFWSAVQQTESVAAGKPVFITETGWPSSELALFSLSPFPSIPLTCLHSEKLLQ